MRFAVVFEKTDNGWSAYAPDLPGLGVAASTLEETKQLLREAIELHIDDLRAAGQPIPAAALQTDYVELKPLCGCGVSYPARITCFAQSALSEPTATTGATGG